jgi:hypothetical protein
VLDGVLGSGYFKSRIGPIAILDLELPVFEFLGHVQSVVLGACLLTDCDAHERTPVPAGTDKDRSSRGMVGGRPTGSAVGADASQVRACVCVRKREKGGVAGRLLV